MLTTKEIMTGTANVSIILWHTGRIRRVCRSSLAAETMELNNGFENADWVRLLLLEARTKDFQLRRWREYRDDVQAVVASDAKSCYDFLNKETGTTTSEKGLAIDMRVLKTYLAGPTLVMRWLPAEFNIADFLTKTRCDKAYLRHVWSTATLA